MANNTEDVELEARLDEYLNNSHWGVTLFAGHRDVLVKETAKFIQQEANRQKLQLLDRLETEMPSKRDTLVGDAYQRTFCGEYNKALKEVSKVIQAERAKLKEVK